MALISSVFQALYWYNSELWTLSSKETKKIDTFQRSFLRQIVRTRYISNKRLYKTCGVEPWSKTIKRQRLTWFGHLIRLRNSAPAKKALAEARKKVPWSTTFNLTNQSPLFFFGWLICLCFLVRCIDCISWCFALY